MGELQIIKFNKRCAEVLRWKCETHYTKQITWHPQTDEHKLVVFGSLRESQLRCFGDKNMHFHSSFDWAMLLVMAAVKKNRDFIHILRSLVHKSLYGGMIVSFTELQVIAMLTATPQQIAQAALEAK